MNNEPKIDDGGPAFPTVPLNHSFLQPELFAGSGTGLKIRDWFAGMALQGMLANGSLPIDTEIQVMADDAYRYADAMLEARNQ